MPETTGANRIYHCEMLLNTLRKLKPGRGGDTRDYLDVDLPEQAILIELLEKELACLT